jgi:hypothetical protein
VAKTKTSVFDGVPTVDVEVESVMSGLPSPKKTGPRPKFRGKHEKMSNVLDGAGVLVDAAPAIAVNLPATLEYSGLKEGVLNATLVEY